MTEDQKAAFRQVMNMTMQTFGKDKPSADVLRVWWGKLEKYTIEDVCKAFDQWIDTKTMAPTPADILDLCRHRVTIHPRLPTPMSVAESKLHVEEVKQAVESFGQPKRDPKAWARRILANTRNYPDISVKFAREAICASE